MSDANPYQSPNRPANVLEAGEVSGTAVCAARAFGCFLLVGGVFSLVAGIVFPEHAIHFPPLEAEAAKRTLVFGIGAVCSVMGWGFLWQQTWALHAFLTYAVIGSGVHVALAFMDLAPREFLFSPLVNIPIAYGVYHATRAAFRQQAHSRRDQVAT